MPVHTAFLITAIPSSYSRDKRLCSSFHPILHNHQKLLSTYKHLLQRKKHNQMIQKHESSYDIYDPDFKYFSSLDRHKTQRTSDILPIKRQSPRRPAIVSRYYTEFRRSSRVSAPQLYLRVGAGGGGRLIAAVPDYTGNCRGAPPALAADLQVVGGDLQFKPSELANSGDDKVDGRRTCWRRSSKVGNRAAETFSSPSLSLPLCLCCFGLSFCTPQRQSARADWPIPAAVSGYGRESGKCFCGWVNCEEDSGWFMGMRWVIVSCGCLDTWRCSGLSFAKYLTWEQLYLFDINVYLLFCV